MVTVNRRQRVVILTGDIDYNIGDLAILRGTCEGIRAVHPNVDITYVSGRGDLPYVDATHVRSGPMGLRRFCGELVRSDLVLCGGGGLFQDDDSLVKIPYWMLRVLLCRMLCKHVIGYSLGVGPVNSRIGRLSAKVAFSAMECVSARDPMAVKIAEGLTRRIVSLVPDPAMSLLPASDDEVTEFLAAHDVPVTAPVLIGVAPRRWYPPKQRFVPQKFRAAFRGNVGQLSSDTRRLAGMLAEVLDALIERHGAHVLLMPTYHASHEGDYLMSKSIAAQMKQRDVQLLPITDPALYKGVSSRLGLMLGGRMHATILATSAGTPAVGLAYNPKFFGLFEMLGFENRVIDVQDFVVNNRVSELTEMASAAIVGPGVSSQTIAALTAKTHQFNLSLPGLSR